MSITLRSRYGAHDVIDDPSQYESAICRLVEELCEERFARPDYEHSAVSVSHASGWFIEATMNGVVALGRLNSDAPDRYQYGLSKKDLVRLFMLLATGKMEQVLDITWGERVGAVRGRGDHFLFADRPDMTDLHRAASVSRGMNVLQAAPAAYPYRSASSPTERVWLSRLRMTSPTPSRMRRGGR